MTPERRRALEMGARLLGGGLNEASVELARETLADGIDDILWRGTMKKQQPQVTLHRTFANGNQMGYAKDGDGFRMYSRPSADDVWLPFEAWDRSWVALADRIEKLPEDADAATR